MKTLFPGHARLRPICASLVSLVSLALTQFTTAAQLKEARVTQVVKDVKLLRTQAAPRPAAVSDEIGDGTAVRTGVDSRAELTFTDQTLARFGANTIFSFKEGTRKVDLASGTMLLYVPKNVGGAKIDTAAVTAAITGTTCLIKSHRNSYTKLIFLEGSGRVFLKRHPDQSVVLHAGEMLIVKSNATSLPHPQKINLRLLRRTSPLLYPPLPSEGLMLAEEQKQLEEAPEGTLVDPTSLDVIDQKTNALPGPRGHLPGKP
ncbi:MAG TPA: FecR family protein [Chthoniobacterales bacterium]|nr:FecR family protein [Chthoniobacterales bacterium]